jgi:hypothetical protein
LPVLPVTQLFILTQTIREKHPFFHLSFIRNLSHTKSATMFGSHILDVVIGIIFLFLLVSIICSSIREGLESIIRSRGAYLEFGIRELLHDKEGRNIGQHFFNHPLIASLFAGDYTKGKNVKPGFNTSGKNLPSYIPAKNFALALMDIAARGSSTNLASSDGQAPAITPESIRMNIVNIENPYVQRVLLTAVDAAQGDMDKLQAYLEDWYNSTMDRVSGWYKRSTQWIIFWIALGVAVIGNINTIAVANYLATNEAARLEAVGLAKKAIGDSTTLNQTGKQASAQLADIAWPVGWGKEGASIRIWKNNTFNFWNNLAFPLLGWFLTALAATMGAPFWFDLLNKIMVIRSTVKPHEKSGEEASEDRQFPSQIKQPIQPIQPAVAVRAPVAQPAQEKLLPTPMDSDSEEDGCHGTITQFTNDEDLPQARGGVA